MNNNKAMFRVFIILLSAFIISPILFETFNKFPDVEKISFENGVGGND